MILERLIVELDADLSGLDKGFLRTNKLAAQLGDNVTRVGQRLTVGLTLPITAVGIAATAAAVKMDSLNRGMIATSRDAATARREISQLQVVAQLPGLGFRDAIQGSIRLQNAGASADTARESLMQFGNAIALVGGGKAELDGVTLALTQILSSGRVLGQEIRQLQERVPQIRQAMIEAFGTARTEEIQAMGIAAEDFIERINVTLARLPRVSGGALNTLENLQDEAFRLGVVLGDTLLPLVVDITSGLTAMSEKLRDTERGTLEWGVALAGALALMGPLTIGVGALTSAAVALNTAFAVGLVPALLGAGGIVVGLGLATAGLIKWALGAAQARAETEKLNQELLEAAEALPRVADGRILATGGLADQVAELRARMQRDLGNMGRTGRPDAPIAPLGMMPGLDISNRMLAELEERADSLSEKAEGLRLDLQFEADAEAAGKLRNEISAVVDELERVNTEIARQRIGGAGVGFRPAFGGQMASIPGTRGKPGLGEGIGDSFFNINRFTDPRARASIVKDALEDTAEGLDGVAQGARLAAPLLGRFGGTISEIIGGIAQGGFMGIGSAIVTGLGAAISGLFGDQRNVLDENTRAIKENTDAILSGLRGASGAQVGDTLKTLERSLQIIDEAGGRGRIKPGQQTIDLIESLGLSVPDPDDIDAWRQIVEVLRSDLFGGLSGRLRIAGLRGDLMDLGSSEQFAGIRQALAASLPPALAAEVAGLSTDSIEMFAAGLLAQIEAGTFDLSQLGDVSLDEFLSAIQQMENLGDSAGSAADELGKLTEAMVNAPQGFKVALARFNATDARGRDSAGGSGPQVRAGGVNVYGGVHIKADRGDDGAALYDKFVRELTRRAARGEVDELTVRLGAE